MKQSKPIKSTERKYIMALTTASHTCRPVRTSRLAAVKRLFAVWRQRRALERLDDAALKDLGLTRDQVDREVRRPIWDAPETWLR